MSGAVFVLKGGAEGENRTPTGSLPADFESATSTIPSHRHCMGYYSTSRRIFQEESYDLAPLPFSPLESGATRCVGGVFTAKAGRELCL